jgi:hypothetical protein
MTRYLAAVMMLQCIWFAHVARAQDATAFRDFVGVVAFTGYPGGLLFQNAFHGNRSTRFLLLKAIASKPDSVKQFELTESQKKVIGALRPVATEVSNESPDEPTLDPTYYSFLSQSQQDRLMLISLHFDGLAGLSHKSIAVRIGLEPSTVGSLTEIVRKQRDSVVLPNFRVRFAQNPSEQDKFRNADFDLRLVVLTNFDIAAVLSAKECEKIGAFMKTNDVAELIDLIKTMAELPTGLDLLHALIAE